MACYAIVSVSLQLVGEGVLGVGEVGGVQVSTFLVQ